jgi:hypothetical protein
MNVLVRLVVCHTQGIQDVSTIRILPSRAPPSRLARRRKVTLGNSGVSISSKLSTSMRLVSMRLTRNSAIGCLPFPPERDLLADYCRSHLHFHSQHLTKQWSGDVTSAERQQQVALPG